MTAVDTGSPTGTDVDEFVASVRAWVTGLGKRRLRNDDTGEGSGWGVDSDDVSVFHALPHDQEAALIAERCAWQRDKFDAGYAAVTWPQADGGLGLSADHAAALAAVEAEFDVPAPHELVSVTTNLIAPTLRALASGPELRALIAPMLRGDILACQLFSEPGAGSDLAALGTRAVRDGDGWVLNGQKVWTSGAQFAHWGEVLARTDPTKPKHRGITAFMVPMDADGVTIRPLRQMSGGSSFNEVFLDDVWIPDHHRIGEVDRGWQVALTTLGFERDASSDTSGVGGSARQCQQLAEWSGADQDPVSRLLLADVLMGDRLAAIAAHRDRMAATGAGVPDATGSVRKLQWVNRLRATSRLATAALGAALAVDHGKWGTFAWHQHVLGEPGYRIAGGTDEIQRNIIAERLLGLPREARADAGRSWAESPR